ncbi:MAG: DNA translocase FtsK [Clostridiales bacterium]|jgi:S-DNA-T family DNA segregation ATPase FtsK/SpoIIIE|nr:DNA translocase FtsK [Clostridiales bacterium]
MGQAKKSGGAKPRKPANIKKEDILGKSGVDPVVSLEIIAIIVSAVSLFLILSVYSESAAGVLGKAIKMGLVGILGVGAYILPFAAITASIYIIFSEDKEAISRRFKAGLGLFAVVITFAHVKSLNSAVKYRMNMEYVLSSFLGASSRNGGLLGALIGYPALKIFDYIGAYIILTAAGLVCAALITGKSFVRTARGVILWAGGAAEAARRERAERGERYEKYAGRGSGDNYDEEYDDPPAPKRARQTRPVKAAPRGSGADAVISVNGERVLLAKEEIAQRKRDAEINLSKMSYAEAVARKRDERRKAKWLEKSKSPSVMFDMEADYSAYGKAAPPADDTGEYEPLIYEPVVREPFSAPAAPEEQPLPEAGEYGGDIIFASESEYDPEAIEIDDIPRAPEAEDTTGGEETAEFNEPEPYEAPYYETPPYKAEREEAPEEAVFGEALVSPLDEAPPWEAEEPADRPEPRAAAPAPRPEPAPAPPPKEYVFPPADLLNAAPPVSTDESRAVVLENSKKLEEALRSFRVEAKVIAVSIGPTVTRYELSPGPGVKVSAISNLADDLALKLAAAGVRIEAPIPGKPAVGIEVPNAEPRPVFIREAIDDIKFHSFGSKLAFALGKDIAGNVVVADIAKMPHMLIAGSTGSGKSVCINTLITSIVYKAKPEEVKLLMIDPKVVELKVYNGIPHLLIPVVTDPKKASGALNWAVREMTSRYEQFADTSVRDLKGFNEFLRESGKPALPQIVIIIDELSDLMMTAGKEVEEAICRLAQMARAAGIHLIIATQRPSVDVITGLIKANIPSKIAFAVSSAIDSRTILGESGAEKLLGRGDMLFYPTGLSKPMRVQGSFISDKEVESVTGFIKRNGAVSYDPKMIEAVTAPAGKGGGDYDGEEDEFTEEAIAFIVKKGKASASMLQRQFRIGYNRASRIIDGLEERGIVAAGDGSSRPREVLMTKFEYQDYESRRE